MARYYDEAKAYADLVRDKNRLKAQISSSTDGITQIRKDDSGRIKLQSEIIVKTRDTTGDTLWDATEDVWGSAKWDGTYTNSKVVLIQRYWNWRTATQLAVGTPDSNIDISHGDIRLKT